MQHLKFPNLSENKRKALSGLKFRDDIAITNIDKGGTVGILDVKDYIKTSEKLLHKVQHNKQLSNDPLM